MAESSVNRRAWLRVELVAVASCLLYVVLAAASAWIETPSVDEFAHVPAGLVHWRYGDLALDRNNPPLAKMWAAAPLAADPSVDVPAYRGAGVGWDPWAHGTRFQRSAGRRYLELMVRARIMTIPLVLMAGWIVYLWSRDLFGRFAGTMSASLFLLCPTILAHGHLATTDVACMTSVLAAVAGWRWAVRRQTWRAFLAAGVALGIALAVKFSALLLVALAPLVFAATIRPTGPAWRLRPVLWRIGGYFLVAWVTVSATLAFDGTFSRLRSLDFDSRAMRTMAARLPAWLPTLVPREYARGIDALRKDIEDGTFRGYLRGQWSRRGWASYYPIAFAIKESEVTVLLMIATIAAFAWMWPGWREALLLLIFPSAFLLYSAFANSLCLGIRYILPAFPMLFIAAGSVFAAAERWSARIGHPARRWWLAGPALGAAALTAALAFPNYIAYFNRFIGGPRNGPQWLVDSNFDWGQDLYRLPDVARRLGAQRIELAYFGHVDPALYGLAAELPTEPRPGVYAVSANYLKGMSYAAVDENGRLDYILKRSPWLTSLEPDEWAGSIAIFDLRGLAAGEQLSALRAYNLGVLALASGKIDAALALLQRASELKPDWERAWVQLGNALVGRQDATGAAGAYRRALDLAPKTSEALNNLAWLVATTPGLGTPAEAVELSQRACALTERENLSYLDTLVTALTAAGQKDEAEAVCREGLEKALRLDDQQTAASFARALEALQR